MLLHILKVKHTGKGKLWYLSNPRDSFTGLIKDRKKILFHKHGWSHIIDFLTVIFVRTLNHYLIKENTIFIYTTSNMVSQNFMSLSLTDKCIGLLNTILIEVQFHQFHSHEDTYTQTLLIYIYMISEMTTLLWENISQYPVQHQSTWTWSLVL